MTSLVVGSDVLEEINNFIREEDATAMFKQSSLEPRVCDQLPDIASFFSGLTDRGFFLKYTKDVKHNGCKLKMCIFSHIDDDKLPCLSPIPFAFGHLVSAHCIAFKKKKCWTCGTFTTNSKKCSGCTVAYFCNSTCQRSGWRLHKANCKKPETIAGSTPWPQVIIINKSFFICVLCFTLLMSFISFASVRFSWRFSAQFAVQFAAMLCQKLLYPFRSRCSYDLD